MSTETVTTDDLTARLGYLRAMAEAAQSTPEAFDLSVVMGDFGRAINALEAVLDLHAPTAFHMHIERCRAHGPEVPSAILRECPMCRTVQYAACDRCHDDQGFSARPEDCKERQAISQWMLGTPVTKQEDPEEGKR